ncbi:GNAT family N-acetyltransferase [Herbiconiux sp. P18]|uniref:GNAT family N-acetyltransferase n=1 Tax=Herbiconiux liangxiaofengii TaxID=3342795 RepID=UPI0035B8CB31
MTQTRPAAPPVRLPEFGIEVPERVFRPRERTVEAPSRARRLRDGLASAGLRRPRVLRGARTEQPFDAPVLHTPRLTLRPHRLTAQDAADWFDLQSDPAVREFLPWPKRSRQESRRHLRDRTRHTRLWQADDFLALAVDFEGRLVGDVSLHLRTVAATKRSVEVGWVVHPQLVGRGLATEAAEALLSFAFGTVRARRALAVTDAQNRRSIALAERLGFVETAGPRPAGAEAAFELAAPRE